jgi:hypothetical protein
MDSVQTFAKVLQTVGTYGTAGTARTTNVVFDRDAYTKAVTEADKALGVTRKELLEAVERIYGEWDELSKSYLLDLGSVTPQITVTDRSGFFKEGQVSYMQNVTITPRQIVSPQSLDLLKFANPLSLELLTKHFETNLRSAWREQASSYRVACSDIARGGFSIRVTCPRLALRTKNSASTIPISVEVLSRTFARVIPRAFEARDPRLHAIFALDVVKLRNATNAFITIDAISVYYQGKISTKSNLAITLPPQSESAPLSLAEYFQSLPSTARKETTAAESARRSIKFGLAFSYQTPSQGRLTLFREVEMSELEAINSP